MAGHNHAGRAEAALAAMVSGNCVCTGSGTFKRPDVQDFRSGPLSSPGLGMLVMSSRLLSTAWQDHARLQEAAPAAKVPYDGVCM